MRIWLYILPSFIRARAVKHPVLGIHLVSEDGGLVLRTYANLRTLDASGAKRILVEAPPTKREWEAVNDRLVRAAAGAGALGDET